MRISAGRIWEIARKLAVEVGYFFEGLDAEPAPPPAPLEHGGWQRSAIELVRKFAQIGDPGVRAIAGLVKTIVDRGR